ESYAAEKSAIKNERPRWNVKDNPCPPSLTPDTKPSHKPSGLTGRTRIERAQSTAYLEAYPSCSPGPAAWTNASRLLRRAKVWERIGELQAEANKRLEPKIDLSRERIGRRLHLASQMAEQDRNPNGITAAELGIAKVFHPIDAPDPNHIDFNS